MSIGRISYQRSRLLIRLVTSLLLHLHSSVHIQAADTIATEDEPLTFRRESRPIAAGSRQVLQFANARKRSSQANPNGRPVSKRPRRSNVENTPPSSSSVPSGSQTPSTTHRNWPFHTSSWYTNPPASSAYCARLYLSFPRTGRAQRLRQYLAFREASKPNSQTGRCCQPAGRTSIPKAAQSIYVLILHVVSACELFSHLSYVWNSESDFSGRDWHGWKNINGQTENIFTKPIGRSTVNLLSQINSKAGKRLDKVRCQKQQEAGGMRLDGSRFHWRDFIAVYSSGRRLMIRLVLSFKVFQL